jgi:hypothetical protein
VPFIAYVHAEEEGGRQPWQPNWRVWRWLLAALPTAFAAANTEGVLSVVLVFTVFGLVLRAFEEAMPRWDGMRDYRQ